MTESRIRLRRMPSFAYRRTCNSHYLCEHLASVLCNRLYQENLDSIGVEYITIVIDGEQAALCSHCRQMCDSGADFDISEGRVGFSIGPA